MTPPDQNQIIIWTCKKNRLSKHNHKYEHKMALWKPLNRPISIYGFSLIIWI